MLRVLEGPIVAREGARMKFSRADVTDPLEATPEITAGATVAGYRFPSPARAPEKSQLLALEDAVIALHDAGVKLAAAVERIDGTARAKH